MEQKQFDTKLTEQIHLDKRDRNLTNEQIEQELVLLDDTSKPYYNVYGYELNSNSRLNVFCDYILYLTDEEKLNSAISYVKKVLGPDFSFDLIEDDLKKQDNGIYSQKDWTIIKAIYFSLFAKYFIFNKTFCNADNPAPQFGINLTKRVITHNFPFVQDLVFRKADILLKQEILKLPFDKAILFLNEEIGKLTDLDHQHRTTISENRIQYYEKLKKAVYENQKFSKQVISQQNNIIKTDKEREFLNKNHFDKKEPESHNNKNCTDENKFSVKEWAIIFYYADQLKLLYESTNLTNKMKDFIHKNKIIKSLSNFKNEYYSAKKRINITNDFPIKKLESIIPYMKINFPTTVTKIENDIIFLQEEMPD